MYHWWWWCLVSKSCPTLLTPWTVVCQAPLSMGFPKQEHWSGLPFPSRDFPDPGIQPTFPVLAGGFFTTEPTGKLSVLLYKPNIDLRGEMEEKEIQIDCYQKAESSFTLLGIQILMHAITKSINIRMNIIQKYTGKISKEIELKLPLRSGLSTGMGSALSSQHRRERLFFSFTLFQYYWRF